jgi:hypothetical protein
MCILMKMKTFSTIIIKISLFGGFFVWYVSFLGHKLCELVQTLATIVSTHSCKKNYSNHNKEKCCSSLAHQFVCCHNFNAKFGIQPNLSLLPLLMNMVILSHIFPHLPTTPSLCWQLQKLIGHAQQS